MGELLATSMEARRGQETSVHLLWEEGTIPMHLVSHPTFQIYFILGRWVWEWEKGLVSKWDKILRVSKRPRVPSSARFISACLSPITVLKHKSKWGLLVLVFHPFSPHEKPELGLHWYPSRSVFHAPSLLVFSEPLEVSTMAADRWNKSYFMRAAKIFSNVKCKPAAPKWFLNNEFHLMSLPLMFWSLKPFLVVVSKVSNSLFLPWVTSWPSGLGI